MVMVSKSSLPDVTSKRQEYEIVRTQMENERSTFLSPWRDQGDYFLPYRPRFTLSDTNRGTRKTQAIIDNTPTDAVRTLKAGMMSGITSPARPWLRMTTPDPRMSDDGEVKRWLDQVTELMQNVFLQSNLYNVLPDIYGDAAVFGTGAILIQEDFQDVMRCYSIPIGTYSIAADHRGLVDTFAREYRRTAKQLVEEFGRDFPGGQIHWDRFSSAIQRAYKLGQSETHFDIIHMIKPNPDFDPDSPLAKHKKFASVHYEKASTLGSEGNPSIEFDSEVFLKESGIDFFPVLVLRWEKTGDDVWGTNCPGIMSIDDNRSLQHMHRMKGQGLDQKIKPTMVGNSSLRGSNPSVIPGKLVITDERNDQKGYRRAFEIDFKISELKEEIADHQRRINKAFYVNLFLMLENLDRKEITATEINERKEEKLLALGPVLESVNEDLLDRLVDIVYILMERQDIIPPAPKILDGVKLKVEYVSIMAQAQKAVGLGSLRAFTDYVINVAAQTGDNTLLNRVNFDGLIKKMGEGFGVDSEVMRTDEEVEALNEQQRQAQAAAQQQDALLNASQTAKNLGEASVKPDGALGAILEGANA